MLLILWTLFTNVHSTTLNEKIYTPIDFGDVHCFRMNNFNSQVGCQTSRDGDSGILYQFESPTEVKENLPSIAEPIIPVIDGSFFNNATASVLLHYSSVVKGLIVIENGIGDNTPYSPEKSCPGDGFNYNENAAESKPLQCLKTQVWNKVGNWLSYFDFPFGIFIIQSKNQQELIIQKAEENKGKDVLIKPYPLWGGEVKAFMNSVKDTSTCIRRGTCDPVSGQNLIVNFLPRPMQIKKPIILFVTKADATAFFRDLSYGGKDSGLGISLLLSVVKSLANVRDKENNFKNFHSDIMISFLQAESFDYSGSQRLAYDLKHNSFGANAYNISMDDIKCVIEIGPLSGSANNLYLHSPSKANEIVKKVRDYFGHYNDTDFQFNAADGIPPASINSFLREDESKPVILLTDGYVELNSRVYGSRYDVLENDEQTTSKIKKLAAIVANVTLELAGGAASAYTDIEESLVGQVLDCFLVDTNCTLLRHLMNGTEPQVGRLDRYSSVGVSNYTGYLINIASYFSKKARPNIAYVDCNDTNTYPWKSFKFEGNCYGLAMNYTSSKSPAFLNKQYDSEKYSTWTESRWSPNFQVRLFLVASTSENVAIFCCGLLYCVLISTFIYQCHRRSGLIFSL